MKLKHYLLLFSVLVLAFVLRIYGLNWDQGNHLHPDERAITMFSLPLHFPKDISEFLSVSSPLNPHFFAYGSLPLYLLKAVGSFASIFYPQAISYDQLNLLGRFISVIFDTGTLIIIFLLGKKLFSRQIGLLSVFFYAISVFPIQAAHFFAVDTTLTFFVLLTLYAIILFYEKPTKTKAVIIGILFGASLATKTSALVLIVSIGTALISDFVLIFIKNPHKPKVWLPHIPKFLRTLFVEGLIIVIFTFASFLIFEPYALLDFKEFWRQTMEQSRMTQDAFAFPYTLQYVGKIPYLHELKNIFLWGLGPILAVLAFIGTLYAAYKTIKQFNNKTIIILTFFLVYFAAVGKFAVGWMRYMLPLYPFLCLFAAVFFYKITKLRIFKQRPLLFFIFHLSFFIFISIWTLSFMRIYSKPNTRVLASQWIYKNVPADKTVAVEHWDDQLPIGGAIQYNIITLPMYESENPIQWQFVNDNLAKTGYLIISSNRLYAPLQRIAKNCEAWRIPQERCPKNAAVYYEKLFSGKLGFKKVSEFSNYPTIPLLNIPINDQAADESFTVYDHPKVMIFKKYLEY